jgi:CubicO group peptidase (beta-lactamase class C family)
VAIPLVAQPGQGYRFSLGISVVAHIITKIIEQPLAEFVAGRIFTPLRMEDTGYFVEPTKQHRLGTTAKAVPKLTGEGGLRFTGEEKGHTSWLGWKGKPAPRGEIPDSMPSDVTGLSGVYSTAADVLAVQQMLLNGGRGPDGRAVLAEEAVAAMTSDQLADDGKLDDKEFNSHAKDRKNSAGRQSGAFGVEAAGQGVGLGLNVVTTPQGARQAAMAGGYSSPACYHGTEWWNDPALGLSVFYGTQLAYGHAVLPDMRQASHHRLSAAWPQTGPAPR